VSFFNGKAHKLRIGQREAFSVLKEKVDTDALYVWFHAASLGEFEQGRPVMEQLKKNKPETKILLTFSPLRVMRFGKIMPAPISFRIYLWIRPGLRKSL